MCKFGVDYEVWFNINVCIVVIVSDFFCFDDVQCIFYVCIVMSFMGYDFLMWEGFGLGVRVVVRCLELLMMFVCLECIVSVW